MTDDVTFGPWLKRQRRLLDLTQEELATRLGYAVTTIRRIEADELRPSKALAEKLADILTLPASDRPAFVQFARGERGAALPLPRPAAVPTAAAAPVTDASAYTMLPARHNLPVQISSFVGRTREMDRLQALLGTSRLVTLTCVGGTGKTRLALEVAQAIYNLRLTIDNSGETEGHPNRQSEIINHQFEDGVWLVELAPLMDAALLPQAVAQVFTLRDDSGRPLLETLTDYLRPRHLLLILDNCEHLIEAASHIADYLLHACPQLHILATSREALGITGEAIFQVPSLSLPGREIALADVVSTLDQFEAIRLFVDRAATAHSEFIATPENIAAIAHICRTLDGIPLAIELAAARVRTLPVAQIAARIDDRFHLLTGGSRVALSRQRTLQGLIDWSYSLLTEAERTLLQRLSVFAGGWTLAAAEAVCGDQNADIRRQRAEADSSPLPTAYRLPPSDVLDLLTRLVEKSLVLVENEGGEGRYRLLETIRQYAREKLEAVGKVEALQDRHLAYYVALAEEAEIKLRGREQMIWLQRLETEHDNFRAALAWSQASPTGGEAGLRLVGALAMFWRERGHWSEGRRWLEVCLEHREAAGRTAARAKALTMTFSLGIGGDKADAVRKCLEESEAIWREIGDTRGLAWTLRCLCWIGVQEGDLTRAAAIGKESLALFEALDDKWGMAWGYGDQGVILFMTYSDMNAARHLCETSLALFEAQGDRLRAVVQGTNLGFIAANEGDVVTTRRRIEERLGVAEPIGDLHGTSVCLDILALLAARDGDTDQAEHYGQEGLSLRRHSGQALDNRLLAVIEAHIALWQKDYSRAETILQAYQPQEGWATPVFIAWAGLALRRGHLARAATLLGAAERDKGLGRTRMLINQYELDYYLTEVKSQLDEQPFAAAWAEGQAMTFEEAIAYTLETTTPQVNS